MTPGARLAAAIGLVAAIDEGRAPADDIVATYFKRHRFAGVKDRAAISEHIYAVLRHRAALAWWIERLGRDLAAEPRLLVLTAALLVLGWRPEQIARACDGDRFRPAPLGEDERSMLAALNGHDLVHPEMPNAVRHNIPGFLEPRLAAVFGKGLGRELAALNQPAALDLRANRLKTDRDAALHALGQEGVKAHATKLSPLGLRVFDRVPLASLKSFKSGWIEVQDEGSQVAALLADARPGMRVVDFCAGAGGKTLALAGGMANRGHLVACDVAPDRLERATQRLRRAGVSIAHRVVLSSERDKWVKRHAQGFDRVFVDAPCTGTGTWRRNPDAKWRLSETDIDELAALQTRILDSAARLVRPGGRLIYVTCSLLAEEDEAQVERFLAAHAEFALVPIGEVWRDAIGGEPPVRMPMLRLSPARHGTDGFFVAVLARHQEAGTRNQDSGARKQDSGTGDDA